MERNGHILVAEDDRTDAFFLERTFSRAGIPVKFTFVNDGQEVIDHLMKIIGQERSEGSGPPDMLLLDINMPRLNGFEVLTWVRKQKALKKMLVVIFSSSDQPEDMERARKLGANSYIVKPHSIEGLNALVGDFKKAWGEGKGWARAA